MDTEKQAKTEVKIHFLSIDRRTGAPIVVLKEEGEDSNRILLIWIGESEGGGYSNAFGKCRAPAPYDTRFAENYD